MRLLKIEYHAVIEVHLDDSGNRYVTIKPILRDSEDTVSRQYSKIMQELGVEIL